MENGGGAAPTGCYKCGRPGHWSRDCPSSSNPNPNPNPNNYNYNSSKPSSSYTSKPSAQQKPAEKPKKAPKTRPKLTPELLLSNDGLGFVLRHFPRAFKYRGRGHEVSDLGNLLGLYAEWHSHLIPYYSFNQFVHKVEEVGGSKRVKLCIKELRDRVANGGDPTKLHEPPVVDDITNHEQDTVNLEEPSVYHEDTSLPNHDTDDFQNDMLREIYEKATEEPSQGLMVVDTSVQKELPNKTPDDDNIRISEELRARIEANRLKALERAAARARASQPQAP